MKFFYCVLIPLFMCCTTAEATVLFEDNFNTTPDWQSIQTQSKYDSCGGSDVALYELTCTSGNNCPPETDYPHNGVAGSGMYDGSYYSSDVDCTGPTNQLYVIDSLYGRGGSGKGVRQKLQGDGYGNWHGGRIGLKITEPQTEIYFRFFAKYQTPWSWGDDGHGQQKFIDISSFPPDWPVNSDPDFFTRFSTGFNQPLMIFVWYSNRSADTVTQARLQTAERYAPKYATNEDEVADQWPSDGNWHSYEARVKLNSAPDTADGEYEFWIDGVSVMSSSVVAWTQRSNWVSGTAYLSYSSASPTYSYLIPSAEQKGFMAVSNHTAGGAEPDWSSAVNLGDIVSDGNGNQWELMSFFQFNNFALFENHYLTFDSGYVDQFVYYDDIVISDSYIGPDYVIGDAPSTGMTLSGCSISGGTIQ